MKIDARLGITAALMLAAAAPALAGDTSDDARAARREREAAQQRYRNAAASPAFAGNGVSADEAQEVWILREAGAQVAGGGGDLKPAHGSKEMRMACCSRDGKASGGGGGAGVSTDEEDPSHAGPG